jgi:hypothetical protein
MNESNRIIEGSYRWQPSLITDTLSQCLARDLAARSCLVSNPLTRKVAQMISTSQLQAGYDQLIVPQLLCHETDDRRDQSKKLIDVPISMST